MLKREKKKKHFREGKNRLEEANQLTGSEKLVMCIRRFTTSAELKPYDIVDSLKDSDISTLRTVNKCAHVKMVYSALLLSL